MNPLPPLFLKIRLKTANGVLYDRYKDITTAFFIFRKLKMLSSNVCISLMPNVTQPGNKCGIYG
jgi:hypothetical protein